MALKQRSGPSGSAGHTCTWGRSFAGRGNSPCQDLAERTGWAHGGTRKVFVAGAVRKRMEEATPISSCSQQPGPTPSLGALCPSEVSGETGPVGIREKDLDPDLERAGAHGPPSYENMPGYTSHQGKLTPTTKCHLTPHRHHDQKKGSNRKMAEHSRR